MNFDVLSDSLKQVSFTHTYWALLLPLILMAADILTGWLQASINGTWDSTKMRKGLFRKSAEIAFLLLALIVQTALVIPLNIFIFISIYICIMEALSVLENLSQAGLPVPGWITSRLKKAVDAMTNDDPLDTIEGPGATDDKDKEGE